MTATMDAISRSLNRPTIVCLTPVRNEAWILPRFLACAELWADHIIIADQGSTDGSLEIARRHPKVTLIENPSRKFNEPERQKLLISEARKIPGPKILFALDADEIFSADVLDSPEWKSALILSPGTILHVRWANILPGATRSSEFDYDLPCGFVDDGSAHCGEAIHSPRIPKPKGAPSFTFKQIRLLHYNLYDPLRLESKRRWYMCLEKHLMPEKRVIHIIDQYNFVGFHARCATTPIPQKWMEGYELKGIDMKSVSRVYIANTDQPVYWYDHEVVDWMEAYGAKFFSKLPIWSTEWMRLWSALATSRGGKKGIDPRGLTTKVIHWFINRLLPIRYKISVRMFFSVLRRAGF